MSSKCAPLIKRAFHQHRIAERISVTRRMDAAPHACGRCLRRKKRWKRAEAREVQQWNVSQQSREVVERPEHPTSSRERAVVFHALGEQVQGSLLDLCPCH